MRRSERSSQPKNDATSGKASHLLETMGRCPQILRRRLQKSRRRPETASCLRGRRAVVHGNRGDIYRNHSVSRDGGTMSLDIKAPSAEVGLSLRKTGRCPETARRRLQKSLCRPETASCLHGRRAVVRGSCGNVWRRRSVSGDGGTTSLDIDTPSAEVAPSSAQVATTQGEVASISVATDHRLATLQQFPGKLSQPGRNSSQPGEPT
jgi:hypothetical protein